MPQQQPNVRLSYSVFMLSFYVSLWICSVLCLKPISVGAILTGWEVLQIFFFVFLFLIGSVVFCMMLSSLFFLCRFYRATSVVMLLSNSFISCGHRDNDDLTVCVFLFLFYLFLFFFWDIKKFFFFMFIYRLFIVKNISFHSIWFQNFL